MTLEESKILVRSFIDEVMNKGNIDAIINFCPEGSMFAGGIKGHIMAMRTAFPDNEFTAEEILAEDDKIAVSGTWRGVNTGPLVGLPAFGRMESPAPPTGNAAAVNAMYIFTVADGKIVSCTTELDQISLLQQLNWTFVPPSQP